MSAIDFKPTTNIATLKSDPAVPSNGGPAGPPKQSRIRRFSSCAVPYYSDQLVKLAVSLKTTGKNHQDGSIKEKLTSKAGIVSNLYVNLLQAI